MPKKGHIVHCNAKMSVRHHRKSHRKTLHPTNRSLPLSSLTTLSPPIDPKQLLKRVTDVRLGPENEFLKISD